MNKTLIDGHDLHMCVDEHVQSLVFPYFSTRNGINAFGFHINCTRERELF